MLTVVKSVFSFSVLCSALMLAGCGGSGSSPEATTAVVVTPPPPVAAVLPAQISGSLNQISGNTILVNDRQLDISQAAILYADATLSAATLQTGMKVLVQTDGRKVTTVKLNPDLSGRVSAVNQQQLQINNLGVDISALKNTPQVGDYVAISTAVTNSGVPVAAALVTLSGAEIPATVEVEGAVQQFNPNQQRFVLNGLEVDYAQSRNVPLDLNNGSWVEVYGTLAGPQLLALDIETERYADNAEIEIEGTITWVDAEQQRFELNRSLNLTVLATTRFEDGRQQDLAPGRVVEVTSRFVNNQPQLIEVEFSAQTQIPPVNQVAEPRFAVTGRVQQQDDALILNGYRFYLSSRTKFDDGLTTNLLDGQQLELEGVLRNGQLQLLEVERADTEQQVDLKGQVEQNAVWGYPADDQSLAAYEGKWVELECQLLNERVSGCRLDD
jgi:hypothetical protein